ncbi:hypothetical protein FHX42_000967 [Saccharopolyspora lacisalsi]|uniref:NACHT domain-containing protein n=1 Tax=Halosaccharopolyspora lacisalsi TaxID=1000566 RepID=A0A839DY12_9PSEU|nr:hypothetical protein [Halosaccharopolyspora lacisalsi]MBA8823638.1 hypothetical protein [Halosaccharopolyspora lacisalsi]
MRRFARHRRPVALASGVLFLALLLTTLVLWGGRDAELAGVVSFGAAVVALLLTSRPPRGAERSEQADAARRLVEAVRDQETRVLDQLLAESGEPRPATDVEFEPAWWKLPELVRHGTDLGGEEGSLRHVAEFYRAGSTGRMVVLGAGGAGKTVLVLTLLRDLVDTLPADLSEPPSRVPVRISASALAPHLDPAEFTTAGAASRRLWDGIAEYLVSTFELSPDGAHALVRRKWILPILDGLDEMDPDTRDPVLAAAVVQALNEQATPVVLTCGEERYKRLARLPASRTGQDRVLRDALAIRLRPLTIDQVVRHIRDRFPDPTAPRVVQRRWEPVLRQLREDPNSPLARALSSPLRLFLAVTVYHDHTRDPVRLIEVGSDELDQHLVDRLVPAMTNRYEGPSDERDEYRPDAVRRWLRTLAEHLGRQSGGREAAPADLHPHTLWISAGRRRMRWRTALFQGLFSTIALAVAAGVLGYDRGYVIPTELLGRLVHLAAIATLPTTVVLSTVLRGKPRRLDLGLLLTRTGTLRALVGAGTGATAGIAVGFLSGLVHEHQLGLAHGLFHGTVLGSVVGIVHGASHEVFLVDRPSRLIVQSRNHYLAVVCTPALALGLLFGPANGLLHESGASAVTGTLLGTSLGTVLGLLGAAASRSPWARYHVAVRELARRGRLPSRLGPFLDWAHTAGLLRMSGAAVQFRHRELQRWMSGTGVTDSEFGPARTGEGLHR